MNTRNNAIIYPPHQVTDDPNNSHSLPAAYYTEEAIFEAELEQIFYKTWQYVSHTSKLTKRGDYITAQIGQENILVINDGKRLKGFYNICKHRAHSLLREKEGRALAITCPAHSWAFGLDGKLRSGPGLEKMQNFSLDDVCLTEVKVETFCGFVFVNLDPEAESFTSLLPDLEQKVRSFVPNPEALVLAERKERPSAVNWKSVMDNYLECYHCPSTHKTLCEVLDLSGYRTTPHGYWSWHQGPGFGETTRANEGSFGFAGAHIFPNFTINFFPNQDNEIMLLHSIPTSAGHSIEVMEIYSSSEALNKEVKENWDWVTDVVTEEDIALVECVQKGMNSRSYNDGRLVVNTERNYLSEHSLHNFHSMVLEYLGAK